MEFTLKEIMDVKYWSPEEIEKILKISGIDKWDTLVEKFEEKKDDFCPNGIDCKKDISDEIILTVGGPVLEPTMPIMEEIDETKPYKDFHVSHSDEMEDWKSRMTKYLQNK